MHIYNRLYILLSREKACGTGDVLIFLIYIYMYDQKEKKKKNHKLFEPLGSFILCLNKH